MGESNHGDHVHLVRCKGGNFEIQSKEEFCQDSKDILQGDTLLWQSFPSTLRFHYNDSSCVSQISESRNWTSSRPHRGFVKSNFKQFVRAAPNTLKGKMLYNPLVTQSSLISLCDIKHNLLLHVPCVLQNGLVGVPHPHPPPSPHPGHTFRHLRYLFIYFESISVTWTSGASGKVIRER